MNLMATSEKSTVPTRKRAVIYCRVSTDKQEQDGESLDYQEDKCRRYAELHDLDVVAVLREAKSGFIHYSLREKLTLARQLVRDGMADMIIVFDLRRFSRNFVHSAMIFEEIESAGAEIVSVSEDIDAYLCKEIPGYSATRFGGKSRALPVAVYHHQRATEGFGKHRYSGCMQSKAEDRAGWQTQD